MDNVLSLRAKEDLAANRVVGFAGTAALGQMWELKDTYSGARAVTTKAADEGEQCPAKLIGGDEQFVETSEAISLGTSNGAFDITTDGKICATAGTPDGYVLESATAAGQIVRCIFDNTIH